MRRGASLVAKNDLFRQADVVTIHLVLSKRTRGLVGANEIGLMKPTSILINASRGSIVDERALIRALESRAIAGAAVDVFDQESCPRRTRSVVSITCSRPLMSDTSLRISIERSTAMSSRTFPRGSTGAKRMSGREYRCLLTRAWFLVGAVMAATKAKTAVPLVASGNVIRVAFWVGVALAFGIWVAVARGTPAAAEYYAAYLLELSLSVDNIFVFVIVFSELHIPAEHQRRVLAWGVTGALVFRAVMITAGITLIQRFEWIM